MKDDIHFRRRKPTGFIAARILGLVVRVPIYDSDKPEPYKAAMLIEAAEKMEWLLNSDQRKEIFGWPTRAMYAKARRWAKQMNDHESCLVSCLPEFMGVDEGAMPW